MLNNLTIISCSYNTPVITKVMLKSFIKVHGNGPFNFLISENSTNNETKDMLFNNNVPYIENKGATHVEGVQALLDKCRTKYALLVDTDIVFKENISSLLQSIDDNEITLAGTVCGSRGGFNLHARVHPWFCIINVHDINKYKIKFNDMIRVKESNSEGFYNNIPINKVPQGNTEPMYDVGATFYEDILKHNLKIANLLNLNVWFKHYEGSSWQRVSGHSGFEHLGNQVWQSFQKEIEYHKDIKIKDKLNKKQSKKFAFFYPVFIPDEIRKEEVFKSFKSWADNVNKHEVDIILGGWAASDEFWDEFETFVVSTGISFHIKRFDKNYGKAHIINNLTTEYLEQNPNCKYFLSCDSDIILPDEEAKKINNISIFQRMENAADDLEITYNKPFAYFALDQLGECFHKHEKFDKELFVSGEHIVWNSKLDGIAGGAIFVSTKFWKECGGYREMGVYSGDDGYLLYDSFSFKKLASVIKSISVFHPNNSSKEYSAWKEKQRNICTGIPLDDINIAVKEADKFWSKNGITK